MEPTLTDEIAKTLAGAVGFYCARCVDLRGEPAYCWWLNYADDRHTTSPTLPARVTYNPCSEIPAHYTVYAFFEGDNFHINTPYVSYCLHDPALVDTLIKDFQDLTALRHRIQTGYTMQELYGTE